MYLSLGGGKDWADYKWLSFEFNRISTVQINTLGISEMELRTRSSWSCVQEKRKVKGFWGLLFRATEYVVISSEEKGFTYGYIYMINGQEHWVSEADYQELRQDFDRVSSAPALKEASK